LFRPNQVIPPSSPSPSDDELIDSDVPSRTTQTVKAVVVPTTMASKPKEPFKRPLPKKKSYDVATASTASPASITGDSLLDYDTPATSVSTTPVSNGSSSNKPTLGRSAAKGKGKRLSQDSLSNLTNNADSTAADKKLALSLQEEEYNFQSSKRQKTSGSTKLKSKALPVEDDEEASSSGLSEFSYDLDDEFALERLIDRPAPPRTATRKSSHPKRGDDSSEFSNNSKAPTTAAGQFRDRRKKVHDEPGKSHVDDSDLSGLSEPESMDDGSELGEFVGDSDDDGSDISSVLPSIAADVVDVAGAGSERTRTRRPRSAREPRLPNRAARERRKLEKAHPEIITMWKDLAASPKIPMKQADQPASINRQLKSFQLEGLNWMVEQEKTKWKGGLLGDEMVSYQVL